jgi:transcriptional regulator with GAF, ATPase, and Fis domain
MTATLVLPPGYRSHAVLSRRPGIVVVRASDREGRDVVLRLEDTAGAETLAELAVLAAVDHVGLARLSDFGPLPGGGRFVARPFESGEPLGTWAKDRPAAAIGALAVALADALQHLHTRGFVHGDLKPGNVIVDASDRPVLVDFGLAQRRGARIGIGGTLVAIAPERIAGAPPEPAADLFALGVLLVELFAGRPDPTTFYARFPDRPFLEAAGIASERLPGFARDVVERLVAREPSQRPASAAVVARTLAARLGLARPSTTTAQELAPPVDLGRRAEVGRATGVLARRAAASWLVLGDAADVAPLARHLRLSAALAGTVARGVDLVRGAPESHSAAALDRWARACAEVDEAPLVVALTRASPWDVRRAEVLVRAARQAGRSAVVVAAATPEDEGLECLRVPDLSADALARHFATALDHDPRADALRVQALGERVARAANGSAVRAARELASLAAAGAFLEGGERPRLRPGLLPAARRQLGSLPPVGSARLSALVGLVVLGLGSAADVAELTGDSERETAAELVAACDLGLAERTDETRFRSAVDPASLDGAIGREVLAEAFARRVRRLGRGDDPRTLVARALAGESGVAPALVTALVEQIDAGAPELVLARLDELERWRVLAEPLDAARCGALRALAWCALSQVDRAEAVLDGLASHETRAAALLERARGRVATARHRPEEALAHLQRAAELDPAGRPEAEVATLHQLYELRRHDEVESRVLALEREGALAPGVWPERPRANALSLAALARFGRGDGDGARRALEALALEEAADPTTRAAVLQNLATVERRVRGAARAVPLLLEAIELLEGAGRLQGVAQVRTALGGTLRDLGELVRAEEELESAFALRERLGDRAGAALARGTLGLVRAERGHLRAALVELDAAARDLVGSAARRHGPLLRARAEELRARLGEPSTDEAEDGTVLDPRELVHRGRALCLRGERWRGQEFFERAATLAQRLDQAPVLEEARVCEELAAGRVPTPRTIDGPAREDAAVARHVLRAPGASQSAALDLVHDLVRRGRDDRAARLALALVRDGACERAPLADLARAALARCEAGMTAREVVVSRRALLGLPDPRPDDLDALASEETFDEDDDMELVSLLEINHRLVQQEDQRALLGEIVEQALAVTGAERGFLVLEVEGELEIDSAMDSARGDIPRPQIEVSRSVVRAALERQESLRVSNAVEDPTLGAAPSVAQLDLRSVLCAPFEVSPELRGAIYVDHRLHAGAFGARAQRLLELLADQAALAIRQVRRIDEIRRLNEQLSERVARQATDLETARRSLRAAGLPAPAGGLVGESSAMQRVRATIERVAPSEISILVHGPSGTGKELAARALHELSDRRAGPFVSENCASLPESLIESELFGYQKGAFTGADRAREGLFERANGGTLFLDEIGEMPRELQSKLLRALETREVRRLGDDRPRPIDVRLVCATNRDLTKEVEAGRFREDLYYRVAGLALRMPSLDERIEDLPLLVEHFLALQAKKDDTRRRVSKDVLARLARRAWPGNVRELRNEVVRLCVLSAGDLDDPELVSAPGPSAARAAQLDTSGSGELLSMAELERRAILGTIERVGGDKRKAADVLGISLSKLYERLKRWREEGEDE